MLGLKTLRENNISHLDIKIDNILLHVPIDDENAQLVLKIGDFGMAK